MINNIDYSKRIAITGATGMLGAQLAIELWRIGYTDITLLVRDLSRLDRLDKQINEELDTYPTYKAFEVKLNNPIQIKDILKDIDSVFHCAAMVSFGDTKQNQNDVIAANIEITSHIVDACIDCKIGKLVHVSSIAALGGMQGDDYIDETTELENLSDISSYSISKFMSENQANRGREMGLKTVVINPSVILGEGDWKSGSSSIIPFVASGLPFYTCGVTGYVDVRDVARAMIGLESCEEAVGERFIISAANLSFRELITKAAAAAGKHAPFIEAGDVLTNIASKVLPRFTHEAARSSLQKNYYKGDKIKRFINFDYTPIDKTIERVVGKYLKHKNG